jgi:hypothetical protein
VVLSRPSEQDRVLRACHDAIRKAPGGTAARYDEQVATPRKHSYVVTGAVGPSLRTAKQWTCQATVADGVVRISSAEIES